MREGKRMAPCGAIPVRTRCATLVAAALVDHDAVAAVVTPATVQAVVPMNAVLGAGNAVFGAGAAIVMIMMATALDDHGLGAGHRRQRDRDRTKSGCDITKLLHVVLLTSVDVKLRVRGNVPKELSENPEQPFSLMRGEACARDGAPRPITSADA